MYSIDSVVSTAVMLMLKSSELVIDDMKNVIVVRVEIGDWNSSDTHIFAYYFRYSLYLTRRYIMCFFGV